MPFGLEVPGAPVAPNAPEDCERAAPPAGLALPLGFAPPTGFAPALGFPFNASKRVTASPTSSVLDSNESPKRVMAPTRPRAKRATIIKISTRSVPPLSLRIIFKLAPFSRSPIIMELYNAKNSPNNVRMMRQNLTLCFSTFLTNTCRTCSHVTRPAPWE